MNAKRLALVATLVAAVAEVLKQMGTAPEAATAAGVRVADAAIDQWCGVLVVFPSDMKRQAALRNLRIRDGFTGANHAELSREHGIGEREVYRILAREPHGDVEASQPGEFLRDFTALVLAVLQAEGLSLPSATTVAAHAADRLTAAHGASQIYFPVGYLLELAEGDEKALQAQRGQTPAEAVQQSGGWVSATFVAAMVERAAVRRLFAGRRCLASVPPASAGSA